MYKTDYLPINIYLQQEGISEIELFEQLGMGEVGLLLNLENIEGMVCGGSCKEVTDNFCKIFTNATNIDTSKIEVTGLFLLTAPYFEILRNNEEYIYLKSPIEIYEGKLKLLVTRADGMGWERLNVQKKNLKAQSHKITQMADSNLLSESEINIQNYISFLPYSFDKKEEALNPKYKVLPYAKSASGRNRYQVYCYAIPKQDLLVAKDDNALSKGYERMFTSRQNIYLDKIVNHFWPKIKYSDKNREILLQSKLAIKAGDICCEVMDNKQFVNPEQFVLWMISKNLFPELAFVKSPVFRYYKYYLEYEKLLDQRIYVRLPKNEKDYIFQLAEQNKINLFIKIKNRERTLKSFLHEPKNSLYSGQELQERRTTYYKIMEKKHYWKLNNFDCFGNYITRLYENDELVCDDRNFIFFESSAIEESLGISFQLQMQKITLGDVFFLEEELAQFNERQLGSDMQNYNQSPNQKDNKHINSSNYVSIEKNFVNTLEYTGKEICNYIEILLEREIIYLYEEIDFFIRPEQYDIEKMGLPRKFTKSISNLPFQDDRELWLWLNESNKNAKVKDIAKLDIDNNRLKTVSFNPIKGYSIETKGFFRWIIKRNLFKNIFDKNGKNILELDCFKQFKKEATSYDNVTQKGKENHNNQGKKLQKYLTIKQAKKYFAALDFDEIDTVLLFFSQYIFHKYAYVLDNKEVKQLYEDIDYETFHFISNKKISFNISDSGGKKREIDIDNLRIKYNFDFKDFVEKLKDRQTPEQRELIVFIKKCCPLLHIYLKGSFIEVKGAFDSDRITIETAAILLTTFIFLQKRLDILQAKNKCNNDELIHLTTKEEQEVLSISERLKKDFEAANFKKEIELGSFIKWVMNNSEYFLLSMNQEVKKCVYLFNDIGRVTFGHRWLALMSIKNYFIVKGLLRIVFEILNAASQLKSLPQNSIIDTGQNQIYTGIDAATLYPDIIGKFAQNFNYRSLTDIAEFKDVINKGMRWFVKCENVQIRNYAKYCTYYSQYPEHRVDKSNRIENRLKLIPFYKLVNTEDSDYITELKNLQKITLDTNTNLELPEELSFLNIHYGYYLRLAQEKLTITLKDIVIPEQELLILEKEVPTIEDHTTESNVISKESDTPEISENDEYDTAPDFSAKKSKHEDFQLFINELFKQGIKEKEFLYELAENYDFTGQTMPENECEYYPVNDAPISHVHFRNKGNKIEIEIRKSVMLTDIPKSFVQSKMILFYLSDKEQWYLMAKDVNGNDASGYIEELKIKGRTKVSNILENKDDIEDAEKEKLFDIFKSGLGFVKRIYYKDGLKKQKSLAFNSVRNFYKRANIAEQN
jgi:hypothetical protein